MVGKAEETGLSTNLSIWGYDTALRVFSDMMDRQDSLSDVERSVFASLGDYLVWYEKTFMPIPPASRAATPEEMAEYEATKRGELVVA